MMTGRGSYLLFMSSESSMQIRRMWISGTYLLTLLTRGEDQTGYRDANLCKSGEEVLLVFRQGGCVVESD